MDQYRARDLPDHLWQRVSKASSRLLLIDYDGTLVPFHVNRMEAKPEPELQATLRELIATGHTRVAIVSGRVILLPGNRLSVSASSREIRSLG